MGLGGLGGTFVPRALPSSLPTSFDLAPLALYSGRGAGGEGFTLCFDLYFDREFNDDPRFRSVNKPLNLRLPSQGSTPHPPTPSPRFGNAVKHFEAEKSGVSFVSGL